MTGPELSRGVWLLHGRSCHDGAIVTSHYASGGCVVTRVGLSQGFGCDEDGIVPSRFGLRRGRCCHERRGSDKDQIVTSHFGL